MTARLDTVCPDLSTLLDHLDGVLDRETTQSVQEHLDRGCPRCDAEVRFLGVATRARGVELEAMPDAVFDKLLEIPKRFSRVPTHLPDDVIAELVFDSSHEPELAGVRHTSIAPTRRFEYLAGDWRVEFDLESSGPREHTLVGQISLMGSDGAPPAVRFRALVNGKELDQETSDASGHFSLRLTQTEAVEIEIVPPAGGRIRIALAQ